MRKRFKELSSRAFLSFGLSLVLCGVLITTTIISRDNINKLQAEQIILEMSLRLNEVISNMLFKTEALATLIVEGQGDIQDFERIAPALVNNDPAILNVLLAPNGIVTKVYPEADNEAVIGHNFFSEGSGNREARAARELGALVLAGPFNLVQGGQALAGRLPVYVDTPTEKHKFWGLVSVTLKFPDALEHVELGLFKISGFAYELWRISPDTGERQIISANLDNAKPNTRYIDKYVDIQNAKWYFRVSPVRFWYHNPVNLVLIATGLLISLFVLFVMQDNFELQKLKAFFEKMAQTDPVTSIYNRHYLEANLKRVISSLSRSNGTLSLLMIDVDLFKNYNDTYGHDRGDTCLKNIAEVLTKGLLRGDDFVARYGGEEFVVVLPNTNEHGARIVAKRLLESMRERDLTHESSDVATHITISIGVTSAMVEHTHIGNDYIKQADRAMYLSKQNGRDRYTYLDL